MKKVIITITLAMLAGLFLLTGCAPNHDATYSYQYPHQPANQYEQNGPTDESNDIDNGYETTQLIVSIDLKENVNLGFSYLHEINYNDAFSPIRDFRFDGEGVRLLIWANQPIYNVSLLAIEHYDMNRFIVTDSVFSISKLDSARAEALVIDSYYGMGTLPWSGITFESEYGTRFYFTIMQSGFDGLFHLNAFEPLATPERVQANESGLVWAVTPTLPHTSLSMCLHGLVDADRNIIDPQTGLLTGILCDGHGGPGPGFVYDPTKELFGHPGSGDGYHSLLGMHPKNEFLEMLDEWSFEFSRGLVTIETVDSSIYEAFGQGEPWGGWWLTEDAFLGQFAIMYNHQFLTDFIFDGGAQRWHNPRLPYIAVSQDRRWGLVGHDGSVILDFMFENLVMVDENYAFAKYNGNYGILDLQATINQ